MRKFFIVALLAGTAGIVALAASLALVSLGGVSAQRTPGGNLEVDGQFVDSATGTPYTFRLLASEDPVEAGFGEVTLLLEGNPNVCSASGPDPVIGNTPLVDIECGTAGAMAVAVDGCFADIEFHGFVHSDHPNTTYMGMTTVDLNFRQVERGGRFEPDAGVIDITIRTPKGMIRLHGSVLGSVVMDTCPFSF